MVGWPNVELCDPGQSPNLSEPHILNPCHGDTEILYPQELGKDMPEAGACPTQGLAPVE